MQGAMHAQIVNFTGCLIWSAEADHKKPRHKNALNIVRVLQKIKSNYNRNKNGFNGHAKRRTWKNKKGNHESTVLQNYKETKIYILYLTSTICVTSYRVINMRKLRFIVPVVFCLLQWKRHIFILSSYFVYINMGYIYIALFYLFFVNYSFKW